MLAISLVHFLLLSPFFLPALAIPHLARRHPHLRSRRTSPESRSRIARSFPSFQQSDTHVPLTKLKVRNEANEGIHSQILLQMHVNKSLKRYAKMTRRDLPTQEELELKIKKRSDNLYPSESEVPLEKRTMWRGGKAMAGMQAGVQEVSKVLLGSGGGRNAAKQGKGQGQGEGSTTSTSNSTAGGFDQADLQAASQGTVTAPEAPTGANSLGLSIEANDVGYFAELQLGTPGANFKILMDSGSADFWVPSTACTACGPHQALGSKTSSTFKASNTPFQVTYGTGDVSGAIISDTVTIANLSLADHQFGVTTNESADFSSSSVPFDGLMGLAQSTLSNQGVPTPIESLASQGIVRAAQMGFHLARLSDGTNDGQVTFGGVDATKFTGSLTQFANVNPQGFWEGAMDDVTVNGASLNLAGRTAILDTGTTLIIAPPADAAAVHAAIPGAKSDGQGGFTVPCTTTASVALSFGGTSFAIKPSDITFLPVTNNLAGDCVSGISSGQVGGANEWLVGDVFLKNVYFATDVGSNSIGLAPSVEG